MNAYFAGSIKGGSWAGQREAYDMILECMRVSGLDIISQHGAVKTDCEMEFYTDSLIFEIDTQWIRDSKILVAEVSVPSLGVGYEIGYALHECHIPVLALCKMGMGTSAMVKGNKHLWYRMYHDAGDVQEYLDYVLTIAQSMENNKVG